MNASLTLVHVSSSSPNLYCIRDTFTYKYSIQSTDGEVVYPVTWSIFYRDRPQRPVIISSVNVDTGTVRSVLTKNISGSVESTLRLTLQYLQENGTTVQCRGPVANTIMRKEVYFRISGMYRHTFRYVRIGTYCV